MARIILITGANRGIGRELAKQLAADGDTVLLGARNFEGATQAAAEIGSNAHAVQLDVSNQASVDAAAKKIEADFGRLDVLVNNVGGVFDYAQQASTADLAVVQQALEINLFSAVRVTQAMLPLLRKAQGARIVNVSSEKGSIASMTAGVPAYGSGHHRQRRLPRLDGYRPRRRRRTPCFRGRGQHQVRRQSARRCRHQRLLSGRQEPGLVMTP